MVGGRRCYILRKVELTSWILPQIYEHEKYGTYRTDGGFMLLNHPLARQSWKFDNDAVYHAVRRPDGLKVQTPQLILTHMNYFVTVGADILVAIKVIYLTKLMLFSKRCR